MTRTPFAAADSFARLKALMPSLYQFGLVLPDEASDSIQFYRPSRMSARWRPYRRESVWTLENIKPAQRLEGRSNFAGQRYAAHFQHNVRRPILLQPMMFIEHRQEVHD